MNKVPFTPAGYKKAQEELDRLTKELPVVIQAIADARAHGDLSENAEYDSAREKQSYLKSKIDALSATISMADVIDVANFVGDKVVRFGATVTVVDEGTEQELVYHIVGAYEADPKHGLISVDSPIAKALISAAIDDEVEVSTPNGVKHYYIKDVQYIVQ